MADTENVLGSAKEVFDKAGVEWLEPVDVESVMAANPNSRFRVIDNPNLAPGVCALCGSAGGDGRQFVDFGKTVDWYGCVYFCTFCVTEAAKLLGLESVAHMGHFISALEDSLKAEEDSKRELQGKLNAAMVLLRNCTCSPVESGDSGASGSVEIGDASESGDPEADESGDVERPDDVSESSGDVEPESKPKRTRTTKSA